MDAFVNPNGELCAENTLFNNCKRVDGVKVTELWGDAYERNEDKPRAVLFSIELLDLLPWNIVRHNRHPRARKRFIESGGGFRLDFTFCPPYKQPD